MQALVVVDVQNEFAPGGYRAVDGYDGALGVIRRRIADARAEDRPIAFIRHHNRPHEWPAFEPGTPGVDYPDGIGPDPHRANEIEFIKTVSGAFTGTPLEAWLRGIGAESILVVGFYAHMCVSTTTREGVMRDLDVSVDPDATLAAALHHPLLGDQSADEVKRTALLELDHFGARITPLEAAKTSA